MPHHITSYVCIPATCRFCGDCKHNVVTAFDILTCKCDLADIDNEDEFLPDLFWPFAGRIGPVPGDLTGQKALLSCPLEVGGSVVVHVTAAVILVIHLRTYISYVPVSTTFTKENDAFHL